MKHILLLALAISTGFTSCTHKAAGYYVTADYLIIGQGGGFRPPLGTYYYLSNSQLLADTSVNLGNPPSDINQFHFDNIMPLSKYASVKNVLTSIPSEILGLNHKEIGISKVAVDGGYTVVRVSINGVRYDWIFHADQSSSSAEIQQFVEKVNVVFQQ